MVPMGGGCSRVGRGLGADEAVHLAESLKDTAECRAARTPSPVSRPTGTRRNYGGIGMVRSAFHSLALPLVSPKGKYTATVAANA